MIDKKNFWTKVTVWLLLPLVFLLPSVTNAYNYETGVWIPWWAEEAGVKGALVNIENIDVIYPFVYEVNADGGLINKVNFRDIHWKKLIREARKEKVLVIPTIAWFDGEQIHETLSSKNKRKAHLNEIVSMVEDNRFAGVDIDYEAKLAETTDYFSTFLKELNKALGRSRKLTCTVEARTPPDSRWKEVPVNIQYANDYRAINQHCDWIEIMAYDQQRADIKLNNKRRGVPYMPVADTEWVEKVLELALEDFDKDKVMLGVATYGRAWDVTVAPDWYRDYERVATLNQPRILELADKYQAPIGRTEGGEAVITFFPEDSVWKILNQLPTPPNTPTGFEAAAKALLVANYAQIEIPVRFITWSDAEAIKQKIDLVEKNKLKGKVIFKLDGEEDKEIWNLF